MSALRFIRDVMAAQADLDACVACANEPSAERGKPEVFILGTNLDFFLCTACTKKHLDVLLDHGYQLVGGENARQLLLDRTEKKLCAPPAT